MSFNSLQTGNCIQTEVIDVIVTTVGKFQFPSNGKLHSNSVESLQSHLIASKFQFPSNGKLHSNSKCSKISKKCILVSIPFKRETAFKRIQEEISRIEGISFNSLQTGNCIQTKVVTVIQGEDSYYVSIPFKRETAFKL